MNLQVLQQLFKIFYNLQIKKKVNFLQQLFAEIWYVDFEKVQLIVSNQRYTN